MFAVLNRHYFAEKYDNCGHNLDIHLYLKKIVIIILKQGHEQR
jgi:hypothetical protein